MLRILLMLGLAAAAGVTAWQVWQLEQARAGQRTDRARLESVALHSTRALLDIRASQRAYLSPGQGIAFWKPRVDQQLLALREDLQALKNGVTSVTAAASAAVSADDAALDALGEVTALERRIAEHVQAGRLDHAADLVYADNISAHLTLDRALDAALTAHRLDLQAQQDELRWREGGVLALAATFGFLFALVVRPSAGAATDNDAVRLRGSAEGDGAFAADLPLNPSGTRAHATDVDRNPAAATADDRRRASPSPLGHSSKPGLGVGDRSAAVAPAKAAAAAAGRGSTAAGAGVARADVASPAAIARAAADASPAGAAAARMHARAPQSAVSPASHAAHDPGRGPERMPAEDEAATRPGSVDAGIAAAANGNVSLVSTAMLAAAADLCVSMARVGDAEGLQPLLARVSDQLDAVGVIVWLQDVDGRSLRPALTHGYAAETLAHLRAIDRDADNATARAFRAGQPQVVAGRGAGPGALVVPMQTSTGCVGVIAAEVRRGREHDPATLALARIVAAQLAMLTASPGDAH